MMRRSTGFDADEARGQLLKEWQNVSALELTTNDYITGSINSVDLKNRLGDIETNCRDRLHGVIWAAVFGLGGFMFGKALLQLHHALAPVVFALALAGFFGRGYLIRHYEDRLTVLAEQ